jgi:tetratricopeptide (TPR) repeat protein
VSDLPSGGARGKKDIPLKISDGDFQTFLANLSAFPLNLRIAVEEYLSARTGPISRRWIWCTRSSTAARCARSPSSSRRPSTAPSRFPATSRRRASPTGEREGLAPLRLFFNKIVPAAILFTIVATLTFCVVYLTNQFVVRPIAAERTYRKGYAAIADERYTQSLSIFDDATKKWQMKRWYFKYARAYREKKQYLTAEIIYERLLNQFKNDKKGGLEYAEMLRTELRNFEKAETVLRRRVLDNHVNDPDGLLALGDTYLDWADEDPSKFEEARKVYASLIELYGRDDEYLVRMMRYFIRTDNLAEVLPLKERFVRRRARIGAQDLVELGGYLLEKRYEPKPGDSEALRSRIEDVRSLLERAKKADPSIPEAHYNMGRFFVYNYKDREAISSLSEALRRFDAATAMSPRRVIRQVDAYRLLGEALARDKEYSRRRTSTPRALPCTSATARNEPRGPTPGWASFTPTTPTSILHLGRPRRGPCQLRAGPRGAERHPVRPHRVGYIQYRKGDYEAALRAMTVAYAEISGDENLLYAIANVLYRRGDYFASQGHYEALMERLEAERLAQRHRFPQARIDHGEFVERYMHASNNLGATLSRLAARTGDSEKRARPRPARGVEPRVGRPDQKPGNPRARQGHEPRLPYVQNVTHPRSTTSRRYTRTYRKP